MSNFKLLATIICIAVLCLGVSAGENFFEFAIPLTPESWNNPNPGQVALTKEADGSVQLTVKPGGTREWLVLEGPSQTIVKREKFCQGRSIQITGEAKTAGAVPSYVLQLRARQSGGRYAWNKAPHYLWETSLEITKAEKLQNWSEIKGAATIGSSCDKLNFEIWLAVPKDAPYTVSLRNLKLKESFTKANLIYSSTTNNIFFKADGLMTVEFADSARLVSWSAKAFDELDNILLTKEGRGKTGEQTITLPGMGFYRIVASGVYEDGSKLENSVTAAVVGEPISESVRLKSRFGSCRVHGSLDIWKQSGCNWEWGIGGIQLKDFVLNSDGSVSPPPGYVPVKVPADYSLMMTVGSFPKWLYKSNAKGDGLYPPKDWALFEKLFEAFAKANPAVKYFATYNEPNASWRGTKDEFVKFNKSMAFGARRGNPDVKVFGPCLYSILMDEFDYLVKGGIFDVQDGVVMHAYVPSTAPEGEFIDRFDQMFASLKKAGKSDLPVHITEYGWCSGEGDWQKPVPELERSRYCARSLTLLTAYPLDNITYFCFQYVGGGEPSYSLLFNNGTPTSTYVAFENTIKWFSEVKKGDARWFRLSPNTNLVLGRAGSKTVCAAWTLKGVETIGLSGIPVRGTDMMGRPLKLAKDSRAVELSPSPCYFELPEGVQMLSMKELPLLTGVPGDILPLKLKKTAALPGVTHQNDKLEISPHAEPGAYLLVGSSDDGAWLAQPLKVLPPMVFKKLDCLISSDGKSMKAAAQLLPGINGRIKASLAVRGGGTSSIEAAAVKDEPLTLSLDIPGFSAGRRMEGTVTVQGMGSIPFKVEKNFDQTMLVCRIMNEDVKGAIDWSEVPAVDISKWGPWPGPIKPTDCSAVIKTAVGKSGFHLLVDVSDDFHYQIADPVSMWMDDSLQIAFDMDASSPWLYNNIGDGRFNGHRIFEYGVAHSSKGGEPVVWRWRADAPDMKANCTDPSVKVSVIRNGANILYEVFFPWRSLGLEDSPAAGSFLGFSLAVNDTDKGGDRHALLLGNGIVDGKDPERFAKLYLVK